MIETRLLQYFLAVAREQGITRAAEALHLSQPTLSRQLKELEDSLGVQLFIRGKRQILLTEEGKYFRARAEEMLSLMDKTESTLKNSHEIIAGDIYIGCGETKAMDFITKIFGDIHALYPDIHFHMFSGDAEAVLDRLDKGLIDIGLLLGPEEDERYEYLELPYRDTFGLIMPREHPLASQAVVQVEDLKKYPVSLPQQLLQGKSEALNRYLKEHTLDTCVSSYNLLYNATFLVEQGICLAVCMDGIVDTQGSRNLTFRPFDPPVTVPVKLVTKKYQTFSSSVRLFLERVRKQVET